MTETTFGTCCVRALVFAALAATGVAAAWICAPGPQHARAADAGRARAADALPADNAADASRLFEGILAGGPKAVFDLAGMIVEPGRGDDAKARYALHGLAVYVSRPAGAPDRPTFVAGVAQRLRRTRSVRVKAFLIRQLGLTSGPESIQTLAAYLPHEELCESAAPALVMIGTESAKAALREALPKTRGRSRATLIQALGLLRDAKSAVLLMAAARDADPDVRTAAWFALGKIGHPAAAPLLMKAAAAGSAYERGKALDACLVLARRLGQAAHKQQAASILRSLWRQHASKQDRHARCAVLQELVSVLGAEAIKEVLAAMKSEDPQIRAAALAAAERVQDKKVLISAAADQACQAALELVLAYLADPALRAEASVAAVKIAWALQDTCPDKVAAAARKVLAAARDANVRKKARDLLDRMAKRQAPPRAPSRRTGETCPAPGRS